MREITALATTGDIQSVTGFDLNRYLGHWYEIARLPHFFERGLSDVSADYEQDGTGLVKVTNSGIRKNGVRISVQGTARFMNSPDRGDLEVSFFPPFWSPYRIIFLTPDYSEAVVTGKTKQYLWILSRNPAMPAFRLSQYLYQLENLGFDLLQLERSGRNGI